MKEHRSISIADQIFDQLEVDILSGKYPKGEILSELRLSGELGVSRTPIREALLRLEQDKLVEETNRGAIVVGISREDMLDMYEIRLQIEGLAAARAAMKITGAQLTQMREIIDLQRLYIEKTMSDSSDNSDKIKDLDSQFHTLLYESTGSGVYFNTLAPMHKKMTKFRKASVMNTGRAAKSVEEHYAIYQALAAHDTDAAKTLTLKHVEKARESIVEMES